MARELDDVEKLFVAQLQTLGGAHIAGSLDNPAVTGRIRFAEVIQEGLVRHLEKDWFRLKPDLLVRNADQDLLVPDTNWKLLDGSKANGKDKHGLSQSDFYQLQAYGHNYLDGEGDVVLIYPKSATFSQPLPMFEFPKTVGLRLWVLPFCLKSCFIVMPEQAPFQSDFVGAELLVLG